MRVIARTLAVSGAAVQVAYYLSEKDAADMKVFG